MAGSLRSLKQRGRLAYALGAGLLLSAALAAIFHLLGAIHPPVAFGQPGAPTSVKAWTDAYDAWSQASLWYGVYFGLSLVAALGFVAALAILAYPRLALILSFVSLNLYFAWSSSLVAFISHSAGSWLTNAIYSQDLYILAKMNLNVFTGDTYVVADVEALALLAAATSSLFLLSLDKGARRALLLSVRAAALSLMVLGAEIAIFDNREFFLHVTQAQVVLDVAPWFSNADLLLSAVMIFALSTWMLRPGGLRPII